MEFPGIRLPYMRLELLNYFQCLADEKYQWQAWVNHQFPPDVQWDAFDEPVHFLFDDTRLADDTIGQIGWTLYDENEVELVAAVVHAIQALFDKYGTELTDDQYLLKPEWQAVLATAKTAYPVLRDNTPADMTWESV